MHFLKDEFEVVGKASGTEALNWIQDGNQPDLVVSDINMPDSSGIEFLHGIRTQPGKKPPVLMLSGMEDSAQRLKCFSLGARDFVLKPFNPAELKLRIRNLLA